MIITRPDRSAPMVSHKSFRSFAVEPARCCLIITAVVILSLAQCCLASSTDESTTEPLLDWSDWQRYRATVKHPALGVKTADIKRARTNIEHHAWARDYATKVEKGVIKYVDRLTSEFLVRMIPETTPLSRLFTPCPACRDQKKPYHPHGTWRWSPAKSEELECTQCRTLFPNEKYPKNIELHSTWGRAQTFSYYGGETFPIFQWEHGRPSFTGNIRARKIEFMAKLSRDFAAAYALTGNAAYADACRKILLRFSDVYPQYLVHCAYGEIADLNPEEAAFSMQRLKEPELTYPPNEPDRTLFKRFWTAGRATGTGMEGVQLRQWTQAYDLTCNATTTDGASIYTSEERLQIERDLLLEATILLVADPQLNNKSIGNRSAVGLVGACLGHPAMVRFGLAAFREMVDDWFLSDGGTPESISYGFMAIAGVRDLSLAFREYSDPPGYVDSDGRRHDELNLFRDSNYPRIWKAFIDCLQPDLTFPPFADSREVTRFPPTDVEIIASMYPDEPRYASLLATLSGKKQTPPDPSTAIYLRTPDFSTTSVSPLTFPDHCRPDLQIGFMRSGEGGRESLLLLSATPWGIHRHQDSLNLYYWKDGHELLTDLGYLWDHADEHMTYRTFAHNLVMIDGEDQETRNRGGKVEFFHAGNHIKAMGASSQAYPDASTYRRTSAQVDHGSGRSYVVDLFEVEGGEIQDYVYHGPGPAAEIIDIALTPYDDSIYDLSRVQSAVTTSTWKMQWDIADDLVFTAWNVPQKNERAFIGSGWGQRDSGNRDRGHTIPYIVRRSKGNGLRQFISVFEGSSPDNSFVKSVKRLCPDHTANVSKTVVLEIQTAIGTDYVAWHQNDMTSPVGFQLPQSKFAVVATRNKKVIWNESVPE